MSINRMLLLVLLIALTGATVAPAQILKKVQQQARQKISGTKTRLEDSVATHATEPLDSVLTRTARPVDSTAARVSSGASVTASNAIRPKDPNADERRMRDGLQAGRVELTSVTFDGDVPSDASRARLDALARVLASLPNAFLIQVHPVEGAGTGAAATTLAGQRAAAIKALLVARGIQSNRLFAAADGQASSAGALVTLTRLQ
jgi:outer membrane protein OmpA-like peptidoglycan-associated protein